MLANKDQQIKFHLKELKKAIRKGWGKPCKDQHPLCSVCITWRAWSDLNEMFKF